MTSRAEYDRLIGEWLAAGRQRPKRGGDLTVADVGIKYLRLAEDYYRKDGRATGSIAGIRVALRLLRQSYGHTLANDFGPLALEALQYRLIDSAVLMGSGYRVVGNHVSAPQGSAPEGAIEGSGNDLFVLGNEVSEAGRSRCSKLYHPISRSTNIPR